VRKWPISKAFANMHVVNRLTV